MHLPAADQYSWDCVPASCPAKVFVHTTQESATSSGRQLVCLPVKKSTAVSQKLSVVWQLRSPARDRSAFSLMVLLGRFTCLRPGPTLISPHRRVRVAHSTAF